MDWLINDKKGNTFLGGLSQVSPTKSGGVDNILNFKTLTIKNNTILTLLYEFQAILWIFLLYYRHLLCATMYYYGWLLHKSHTYVILNLQNNFWAKIVVNYSKLEWFRKDHTDQWKHSNYAWDKANNWHIYNLM